MQRRRKKEGKKGSSISFSTKSKYAASLLLLPFVSQFFSILYILYFIFYIYLYILSSFIVELIWKVMNAKKKKRLLDFFQYKIKAQENGSLKVSEIFYCNNLTAQMKADLSPISLPSFTQFFFSKFIYFSFSNFIYFSFVMPFSFRVHQAR